MADRTRYTANLVSDSNLYVDISTDRVGVGSTTPQYKLDIIGDVNVTGFFRQNGSITVSSRWTSGIGDDIYKLNGDVGIGTTNPTAKLEVQGDLNGTAFESYELDDISTSANGVENTFTPTFDYQTVTITNPFKLMITVNGILQSAFINNTDCVFQSHFLGANNGYTIDYDNKIKFTESIPTGSDVIMRVLPVSNTLTKIRRYKPFSPADILLGY